MNDKITGGGFDVGVMDLIQQIRTNLKGYSGKSWLKEMIQNADDAQATRLDLGWVTEIPGFHFENPLLGKSPAVFILNNGPFA